jgi:hypothetical protein
LRPSSRSSLRTRRVGDGHPGGKILQYAGDLTYLGGHVLKSAVSHAIYLQRQTGSQCTIATCWGDPEGFLRDLGNSDFIHVIDQYVGLHDANRYTVGFHATVNYTPQATPLLDSDIQAVVHAVAAQSGASGYAITDPDLDAWRNEGAAYLCTDEVADECRFYVILDGQYYGDVPTFLIGAHRYAVQLVYSNEQHACSSAP